MSQENVEVARGGYEAFAGGDFDAVLAALDSSIEVHPDPETMGEDTYRGPSGLKAVL
jgi:hypothetical protein